VFACLYHVANYPLPSTLRRPLRGFHQFEVKLGKHTLFAANAPFKTLQTKTDGSAVRLGEWGYRLRYFIRQFPFDMVEERNSIPLHLFHRSDFALQYPDREAKPLPFIPVVGDFFRELQEKKVTTVLVPIPTHLSIDGKRAFPRGLPSKTLWGDRAAPSPENPRAVFDEVYRPTAEYAVDLFAAYADHYERNPDDELFVSYDFHWCSRGIAVAAKAVVDKLRRMGWRVPSPSVIPAGGKTVNTFRTSLNYLQLPKSYLLSQPEFQFDEVHYRLNPNPSKIPKNNGRLILVGTSFALSMEEQNLSFGEVLGSYLGRKVVQFAHHGAGARGALEKMKREGFAFEEGDLLVYELWVPYAHKENGSPLPLLEVNAPEPASGN
jgi:hypothetical protein